MTTPTAATGPIDVLRFWWAAGPAAWFEADPAFDARVGAVCGGLVDAAAGGALDDWRTSPHGALALILLTDQVPRNLYRRTPRAFATDAKALELAREALAAGFPDAFPLPARSFFYLPFEHAEDRAAQALSVDLFRAAGDRDLYFYALLHADAIHRFGRFPHRNAILGRVSTPAEEAYLASGGFNA